MLFLVVASKVMTSWLHLEWSIYRQLLHLVVLKPLKKVRSIIDLDFRLDLEKVPPSEFITSTSFIKEALFWRSYLTNSAAF